MTINDRIKELRKKLGFTQIEFAEKIGLKKSAASWIEKNGSNVTTQNIQLICNAFNVSERWLVEGTGEMFTNAEEQLLNKMVKAYNMSAEELAFVRHWLEQPDEVRHIVIDYAMGLATRIARVRGIDIDSPQSPGFIPGPAHKNGGQPIATPSAQPFPHPSEVMGVSHSDTSAQQASFPGSDHVAESKASYHAPADSSARPAGISDDEWQLLQAARREKAQTSGTSGSISSEENRA